MTTQQVDVVIIGAGLAGTTLAWQLRKLGVTFAIIDDGRLGASHVAAGLITPVTGKALRVQPDYARLLRSAQHLYRHVEQTTGCPLLDVQTTVRHLTDAKSQSVWQQRGALGIAYADATPAGANDEQSLRVPSLTLRCTYRLNVPQYLAASRAVWQAMGAYRRGAPNDAQIAQALAKPEHGLHCADGRIAAKYIVCCRGAFDRHSPWFNGLRWRCAKGDLLQIQSEQPFAPIRVHASGLWLCPTASHSAMLGATYSWDVLNNAPDADAQRFLLDKAPALTANPITVTQHLAGVRPIVGGREPVIGSVPDQPNLLLCNGLGSKGSLLAPQVTGQLARYLARGTPIAAQFSLQQRLAGLAA
ncbi:MAG: FAD-dependent oxidoreductase [Pseudomonadota bacterium]